MSDDTETYRRPDFEPTSIETMGLAKLDANTQKIILTLLRIEKKVEYGLVVAERADKLARRHEKVLSPVVRLLTWSGSAIGTMLLVVEIYKLIVKP